MLELLLKLAWCYSIWGLKPKPAEILGLVKDGLFMQIKSKFFHFYP